MDRLKAKTVIIAFFAIIFLFFMSSILFSAVPGTLRLDFALTDEGEPISGSKAVRVFIYADRADEAVWDERHLNVEFVNGNAFLILGKENPIPESIFGTTDLEFGIRVNQKEIKIPVSSVPYSLRSGKANRAFRVEDENLIYFDDDLLRIGIGTVAPTAKLHINGGLKIGQVDGGATPVNGTIRWTGTDYEVKKAGVWKSLTYESNISDQSKWGLSNTGIYAKTSGNVGIGTASPVYKLDVNGNGSFPGTLYTDDGLRVEGDLLLGNYIFSNDGYITANSLVLLSGNSWNNGNLTFSGVLSGEGSNILNIPATAVRDQAFTAIKFTPNCITNEKFATGGVNASNITPNSLALGKFAIPSIGTVQIQDSTLKTEKFFDGDITPEKIAIGTIVTTNIAEFGRWITFEKIATSAVIEEKIASGAVTSAKFNTGVISADKITANVITSQKIAAAQITTSKLDTDSVTNTKISGPINIAAGGTHKTNFSNGSLIFIGSGGSDYDQDPLNLFWNDTSNYFGLGTASPSQKMHLYSISSPPVKMLIESTSNYKSGITIKNNQSIWKIYADEIGNLAFYNDSQATLSMLINPSGNVGLGISDPKESLHLKNALSLSTANYSTPGTIQVKDGILVGRLANEWRPLFLHFGGKSYGSGNFAGTANNAVGGGTNNQARGTGSIVLGGTENIASGNSCFIGGGKNNQVKVDYATILGGVSNNVFSGNPSTAFGFIGSGKNNYVSGNSSVVVGGEENAVTGDFSLVAGGTSNVVIGDYSAAGGGASNNVLADWSAVVGGHNNVITLDYKVKGGEDNPIIAFLNKKIPQYAYIGGGKNNQINKSFGVISGGEQNKVTGIAGTISGGSKNTASGKAANIGGGQNNKAIGPESVIAGGTFNQALGHGTAISGGQKNIGKGRYTNIGGGQNNLASGQNSVIAGGANNRASGYYSGISGGADNQAIGQASIVGGGQENKVKGSYSYVGSGLGNKAEGDLAVISGGAGNYIESYGSVIGGGEFNLIKGSYASIGGGSENEAIGKASVIAGGIANEAKSAYSTVIGGKDNKAIGKASVSLGGQKNEAIGAGSIAAGTKAKAKHEGTFIFSDRSSKKEFTTTGKNKFMVRAQGGVEFYKGSVGDDSSSLIGAVLDGGSWAHTSDRNKKTNFRNEDPIKILEKLISVPIQSWEYKGIKASRHIGPVSQDFYRVFGYGKDDKHISAVDADGVALASIQGLVKIYEKDRDKINYLSNEINKKYLELEKLTNAINRQNNKIFEHRKKAIRQKKLIKIFYNENSEQDILITNLRQQKKKNIKRINKLERILNGKKEYGYFLGLILGGFLLGNAIVLIRKKR